MRKHKFLFAFICIAICQLVFSAKSSAQFQALNIDIDTKEDFAILFLKLKNEFQVTDAKLQLPSSQKQIVDTMERRLRTIENQADILGYMNVQGWNLDKSHFALNTTGQQYPFAYMVYIYRRPKKH